jgi:hypothetical protein
MQIWKSKKVHKLLILMNILVFILAAPGTANAVKFKETDDSYYTRIAKSCEFTTRDTWRDYLLYAPHKRTDQCCMESVKQMAKMGVREANGRTCPDGTQINALKCTNSKSWCEPVKAGKN